MRRLLTQLVALALFAGGMGAQFPFPIGFAATGGGPSLEVRDIRAKTIPSTSGQPAFRVYSAKFLCGTIPPLPGNPQFPSPPNLLVPGTYLTAVNLHNPNFELVRFQKKAVQTLPEPKLVPPGPPQPEQLPPDFGMEVDCSTILTLLGLPGFNLTTTFIKGFVVIQVPQVPVPVELDVVGVYTLKNVERIIQPLPVCDVTTNPFCAKLSILPPPH